MKNNHNYIFKQVLRWKEVNIKITDIFKVQNT